MLLGKRFIYACIAIVCASVVAIMLKFPPKEYTIIVGIISGVFTAGQSYTDYKGGKNV